MITGKPVTTKAKQIWSYETYEFFGICVIARDVMTIKFRFDCQGTEFHDVLEIDRVIRRLLTQPVSVEGIADALASELPGVLVTAMGKAQSHGLITASVKHGGDE